MERNILEMIKHRDELFIKKFCLQHKHLTNDAREVYVCGNVDASEMLNFMHVFDAELLELAKNHV